MATWQQAIGNGSTDKGDLRPGHPGSVRAAFVFSALLGSGRSIKTGIIGIFWTHANLDTGYVPMAVSPSAGELTSQQACIYSRLAATATYATTLGSSSYSALTFCGVSLTPLFHAVP